MTATPGIEVRNLSKTYLVPVRGAGLREAVRSLLQRRTERVEAVRDVSFSVDEGEVVGFLGPNGAGKTTTLKMLSGLLHPSAGTVSVLGFEPSRRQGEFLRRITLVMGQRNQLVWDIPVTDSLERNRVIYGLSSGEYSERLEELVSLLDLQDLLQKPVRNLSLGERMKCELAAALLHRPAVLFLDEPTLGVDVTMQRRIRAFIADYNRRHGATVLLTSHYMADVEALCRRVIVIHHGSVLFDGELDRLVERFTHEKTIAVRLADGAADLSAYGAILGRDGDSIRLRVSKAETPKVTARLLSELQVVDLTVEDPPIEDVIEQVFAEPEGQEI